MYCNSNDYNIKECVSYNNHQKFISLIYNNNNHVIFITENDVKNKEKHVNYRL
jgi:hypothetical protein